MDLPGGKDQPGLEVKSERNWKLWIWIAVILILGIFVAQNAQKVEVDFLFTETKTPLIFALLISGLLGVLIGVLGPRVRRGKDD